MKQVDKENLTVCAWISQLILTPILRLWLSSHGWEFEADFSKTAREHLFITVGWRSVVEAHGVWMLQGQG